MTDALAENEQSVTFEENHMNTTSYGDSNDESLPTCVYALDPRPSGLGIASATSTSKSQSQNSKSQSRDDKFWQNLVPTGVSWSSTGHSIAVSYGRFDVTGWCDSPGALCVWNLRKQSIDPKKPDHAFETDSCLQSVSCHPTVPSLICAGSFDGEVYVWDVSGGEGNGGQGDSSDDDSDLKSPNLRVVNTQAEYLRARSAVSDASHREPVTSVAWLKNASATASRFSKTTTHEVVSFGSDGRVLVWDFTKVETGSGDRSVNGKTEKGSRRMPFPQFGWETKSQNSGTGKMLVNGIAAASFFEPTKGTGSVRRDGVSSNRFLIGCDSGNVYECTTKGYSETASTGFYKKSLADGNGAPQMKSPIVSTHESHSGAVHGIALNRFSDTLFASVGADGSLKIHNRKTQKKVLSCEPKCGALFCAKWSPSKPLLIAAGTANGTVVLYDLAGGGSGDSGGIAGDILDSVAPVAELTGCRLGTPTQAIAFNEKLPEYLASADGGAVRIWELGAWFINPKQNETNALRNLTGEGGG